MSKQPKNKSIKPKKTKKNKLAMAAGATAAVVGTVAVTATVAGEVRRRRRRVQDGDPEPLPQPEGAATVPDPPELSLRYRVVKRAFDTVSSSAVLVALSPVLAATAVAVKATSPGPVVFSQDRYGKDRRPFTCYKFRSMKIDTPPDVPTAEMNENPAVMTPIGATLRKTSLDELPQLVNIAMGDMSVVGPRPVIMTEHEQVEAREVYGANDIRPGLTGWAQVNGRDMVTVEQKARLDGEYRRNMGPAMDAEVIAKSLGVVLSGKGYSKGKHDKRKAKKAAEAENARLEKPRILIVCEHYYPHTDACAKRMTVMAHELMARGFEVRVIASDTSFIDPEDRSDARPEAVYSETFRMETKTVINRLKNNASEMFGAVKVAKELGDFDVVVCTTPPLMLTLGAMQIAKSMHAKFVLDVRDIWPDVAYEMGSFTPRSIYGITFSTIANLAYRQADLITTVGPAKVQKIAMKPHCTEDGKVELVPNGLDLDFLDQEEREDVVARYIPDENDLPCVYIGNLGLAQGLSTLLDIAEAYPRKRFLLFGSGAEEELLRYEIEHRSLANVELCGRIDPAGVYTLLKHAGCAYVPLKNSKMRDSVPTKLYEALGCGCPVLLAAQGDSAAVLRECGLGEAVAPEDTDGLIEAFGRVTERSWTPAEREAAVACIRERHSRQNAASIFADLLASRYAKAASNSEPAAVPTAESMPPAAEGARA